MLLCVYPQKSCSVRTGGVFKLDCQPVHVHRSLFIHSGEPTRPLPAGQNHKLFFFFFFFLFVSVASLVFYLKFVFNCFHTPLNVRIVWLFLFFFLLVHLATCYRSFFFFCLYYFNFFYFSFSLCTGRNDTHKTSVFLFFANFVFDSYFYLDKRLLEGETRRHFVWKALGHHHHHFDVKREREWQSWVVFFFVFHFKSPRPNTRPARIRGGRTREINSNTTATRPGDRVVSFAWHPTRMARSAKCVCSLEEYDKRTGKYVATNTKWGFNKFFVFFRDWKGFLLFSDTKKRFRVKVEPLFYAANTVHQPTVNLCWVAR